ncbi:MAG: outer membrane protein assembly factor BamD [Mariprofundaceae bacterium]
MLTKRSFRSSLLLLMTALLAGGCAKKVELDPNASAKAEYEAAKRKIAHGDYTMANLALEKFPARHPYSKYAVKAELLRIFAAWKGGEFVLSETLADRFIQRHPRHPNVDYAKYMLAMSHYRERQGPEHDPTQTMAAIESFKRLIADHPDSEYARDGAARLQRLYNELASHELEVGKFYFDRGRFVAAANRFQIIIDRYQTTPSIEEALYWLAASQARLGLREDARISAKLLRHNYPRSPWSEKARHFLGG